jgi:hypothetical protein
MQILRYKTIDRMLSSIRFFLFISVYIQKKQGMQYAFLVLEIAAEGIEPPTSRV